MKPEIIIDSWEGRHNKSDYRSRLEKAKLYKDQSTICVVPTRGVITAKVVQNWLGMMTPMNQKFTRIFMIGLEVGDAYSQAVDAILDSPELSKWKYMLTLEEDNMVPPDGLIKLIESIGDYDAVGGLYWTKGEEGQPMCYGRPGQVPINFIPQIPEVDTLTPCNGLGMGFTLFKIDSLKKMKEKIKGPLFVTKQVYEPGKGVHCYTQDLWHYQQGVEMGLKYACDSRVRVGHYDANTDIVW
jgi:hypothetical protein